MVSLVKLVVSFGSGPTTRASRCSLDMVTEIWSARRWWVMASVMFVARTPMRWKGMDVRRRGPSVFVCFVRGRQRTEDDGGAHSRRVLLFLIVHDILQELDIPFAGVEAGVGQGVGDHDDAVVSERELPGGPAALAIRRDEEVDGVSVLALHVRVAARVEALVRPLILLLERPHAPVVGRVLRLLLGLLELDHGARESERRVVREAKNRKTTTRRLQE